MKSVALASFAILCLALTVVVLTLPGAIGKAVAERTDALGTRLDDYAEQIGGRLDARDRQVGIVLAKADEYATMAAADARSNTDTVAVILRDVAEMTHTVNTRILPEVSELLASVKTSLAIVESIRADVHTLSVTAGADLQSLQSALDNAATLLASFDKAVTERSPEAGKIAAAAEQAVTDLDKLLADPNVSKTMAHVEGISDSTDRIMQRMATKAGLLKTILRVLAQEVHVTFFRPF